MKFKEFIEDYKDTLDYVSERFVELKTGTNRKLDSFEAEFYDDYMDVYDMFFYWVLTDIREKLFRITEALLKDDGRYTEDEYCWYFNIEDDELLEGMAQVILNTDESIFDSDEVEKAMFMMIKYAVSNLKKYDYDSLVYESFEENVIPEIFYIITKNDKEKLKQLNEDSFMINFVKSREKQVMDWEKLL